MSACDCPSRGEAPHSIDCATTVPEQAAGQRAADNQQRARSLLAFPAERGDIARVAAALDEAEARGRAERNTVWKAKVEALAAEFEAMSHEAAHMAALPIGSEGLAAAARAYGRAAHEFRALVADLVPGAQTDGEAGR